MNKANWMTAMTGAALFCVLMTLAVMFMYFGRASVGNDCKRDGFSWIDGSKYICTMAAAR